MSDTPSDLASRAQAREEVAEPIHRAMCNDGWEDCVESSARWTGATALTRTPRRGHDEQ